MHISNYQKARLQHERMGGYLEVLADWLGEFYHDDEEPADEECNDIRERLDEQAVSYVLRFTEAKFDETRT